MDILIGRLHPLLVHLPIGFILFAFIFESFALYHKSLVTHRKPILFAYFISFVASVITMASGLLLAQNEVFIPDSLSLHKWMGIGLMVLSLLVFIIKWRRTDLSVKTSYSASLLLIILVSLTGHFGGILTHGKGYLFDGAPVWIKNLSGLNSNHYSDQLKATPPDSVLVYADLIKPILYSKCVACHNGNETFGGFDATNFSALFEEGENGRPVVRRNVASSTLFHLVSLPESDKRFMPPDGQPLNYTELLIFKYWIEQGADTLTKFDFNTMNKELVRLLFQDFGLDYSPRPYYEKVVADSIDEEIFESLSQAGFSSNYLAENNFFLDIEFTADTFMESHLNALNSVRNNLTILDMSGCVISEQVLLNFSQFEHLTRLDLNKTNVTDDAFDHFNKLEHLEVVNLFETPVSDIGFAHILEAPQLKRIYVWETNITHSYLERTIMEQDKVQIDTGFVFEYVPEPDSTGSDPGNR